MDETTLAELESKIPMARAQVQDVARKVLAWYRGESDNQKEILDLALETAAPLAIEYMALYAPGYDACIAHAVLSVAENSAKGLRRALDKMRG